MFILLFQATPTESTVSHTASSRRAARSSRGTAEHTLPFQSSSSTSLSQAPPTTTADGTLVDDDQGGVGGGVKGVEPKPVVLNSVYTNGMGWASQVPKICNNNKEVSKLIILWLLFLSCRLVIFGCSIMMGLSWRYSLPLVTPQLLSTSTHRDRKQGNNKIITWHPQTLGHPQSPQSFENMGVAWGRG